MHISEAVNSVPPLINAFNSIVDAFSFYKKT